MFGESETASDGLDPPPFDVEHAPYPPLYTPAIYSIVESTKLSKDTRFGPADSKTWEVFVHNPDTIPTTVTLTWDVSSIPTDEYSSVRLMDNDTGVSVDMRVESSYQ